MSFKFRFKPLMESLLILLNLTVIVESLRTIQEFKKIDNIYSYPSIEDVENVAVFITDCFYVLNRPALLLAHNGTKTERHQNIIHDFKANLTTALSNAMEKITFYDKVPKSLSRKLSDYEKECINHIIYKLEMMDSIKFFSGIVANMKMHREVQKYVESLSHEGRGVSQFIFFMAYTGLIDSVLKTLALDFFNYYNNNTFNENVTNYDFDGQTALILSRVLKSLENYHQTLRTMVTWADKKIENNDPIQLKRDINFIELERVFQPFLVNSRSLDGHRQCRTIKNFLWKTEKLDNEILCEGYTSDCVPVGSMAYCTGPQNQFRRVEWMGFGDSFPLDDNVDDDQVFEIKRVAGKNSCGDMRFCHKPLNFTIKNRESIWNYNENCLCICTENTYFSSKSTFIISSQFVESDIHENKIVVGLRFVKKERIIYTQIEQAELLPGGWIRNKTAGWKEITPLDRKIINKDLLDRTKQKKEEYLSEDYIIIDKDTKNINLDDLECDDISHVVTGVGLKLQKIHENDNRIYLAIKCQNTSFIDGQLIYSGEYYIKNMENHSVRKEIGELPPIKIFDEHKSNYDANDKRRYFVELQMSSPKKDAGQSIIPWFDAQSVTLNEETSPLNGIGLYHRGAKDSGGFLAYRLFTLDHSILI